MLLMIRLSQFSGLVSCVASSFIHHVVHAGLFQGVKPPSIFFLILLLCFHSSPNEVFEIIASGSRAPPETLT